MHDTANDAEKIGAKLGDCGPAPSKAELIRLAGQMVRATSMPDIESWTWPVRVPKRLWAEAREAEDVACAQCIQWAMAIKEIADGLPSVLGVPEAFRVDPWAHQREKDRADGWNACREAMLTGTPVQPHG